MTLDRNVRFSNKVNPDTFKANNTVKMYLSAENVVLLEFLEMHI